MDLTERMTELARKLTSATNSEKADWQALSNTSFLLEAPSGRVYVASQDEDGFAPFVMELRTSEGKTIETLYSGSFDTPTVSFDVIEALYEAARLQALKIDEIIESVIRDVDEGKTKKKSFDPDEIPF